MRMLRITNNANNYLCFIIIRIIRICGICILICSIRIIFIIIAIYFKITNLFLEKKQEPLNVVPVDIITVYITLNERTFSFSFTSSTFVEPADQ